jgi:ATP-dependent DNA helicase RecG
MTASELKKILARGEDIVTEYKKCTSQISNSVYETVCSFSNRYGGYLILGAANDGTVLGVDKEAVAKLKIDFANALNNTEKMFPTLHLSFEEVKINSKMVLWV